MIYPLAATGKISASVDWLFHSARVEQIYDNLRQGCKFTFIATAYRRWIVFILPRWFPLYLGLTEIYLFTN